MEGRWKSRFERSLMGQTQVCRKQGRTSQGSWKTRSMISRRLNPSFIRRRIMKGLFRRSRTPAGKCCRPHQSIHPSRRQPSFHPPPHLQIFPPPPITIPPLHLRSPGPIPHPLGALGSAAPPPCPHPPAQQPQTPTAHPHQLPLGVS